MSPWARENLFLNSLNRENKLTGRILKYKNMHTYNNLYDQKKK